MRCVLGPLSYELSIKALGEAGIVFSRLSTMSSDGQEEFEFFPERFCSSLSNSVFIVFSVFLIPTCSPY